MTLNILIDKCLWMINAELTKSCLFTEYPCTARSVLFDWHTGFTPSLIHVPAKSCSHNSGYNMLNVILTKYQNKLQLKKKKKKKTASEAVFILDHRVNYMASNPEFSNPDPGTTLCVLFYTPNSVHEPSTNDPSWMWKESKMCNVGVLQDQD